MPSRLGRAGVLQTAHGNIATPAFVAVGTKASVKALTPEMLASVGAQVLIANTFHLYLEPGEKTVEQGGGVGKFMGWSGPTMTDSGGFQVLSLGGGAKFGERSNNSGLVSIDEDGVNFRSPLDGSTHRFTPEKSIELQHALGADIIFAFDECTAPDAPRAYQREAVERTHRWAERSLRAHKAPLSSHASPPPARRVALLGSPLSRALTPLGSLTNHAGSPAQGSDTGLCALFGIVQGGRYEDLRKESARVIGAMELARPDGSRGGFDGFGIGGSFDKEDMGTAVRWVNEILPEEKPRHLLGIGGIEDLFVAVENGCDTFDCVAPTREARTGSLYTRHGRINITNAQFRTDFSPLDAGCSCYTCKHFTRAYLAHLFHAKELLAYTLASIHNLHFFVSLVAGMRAAIVEGRFEEYKEKFLEKYL